MKSVTYILSKYAKIKLNTSSIHPTLTYLRKTQIFNTPSSRTEYFRNTPNI